MFQHRKVLTACLLAVCIVGILLAQTQVIKNRVIYGETVEPSAPSSGYQIPWFDTTGHIAKSKNSANLIQSAPGFYSVAVLPPATGGSTGYVYHMTKATTANVCPTGGDSGGTASAWCFDNGTTYNPVVGLNASQIFTLGGFATLGSATTGVGKAQCWKSAQLMGYCSSAVGSDGTCTCN